MPHVVLTSAYDAGNDRTSLSATVSGKADCLNNYAYDADQRLTDETQTGQQGGNGVDPKQIEFQYNALGQFTNVARYNFVGVGPMVDVASGAFTYDGGNRMTGLNYSYDGGQHAIDAYTWGFDNADRVTSVNSTVDGTASYGYDPTSQLTSASYTGTNAPPNAAYSFDKNGNRTMTGYTTGTDNQITSDGTFNYQFDGEGNRTVRTRISSAQANDHQTKFIYDYRNRLTDEEYFNNSGTLTKHVHYVYDVMDREIGKQVDDTGGGSYDRSEWYAYDGTQPVEQFDGSGNQTMRDFSGPSASGVDAVMAQEPIVTQGHAGSSNWDLADNLGTMRYMVSDASTVVDHVISDAFGQTTSESNISISHWQAFAGGHGDSDTHDVLNGERRYDTTTGAWQTNDPIGFAGGDANTGRYSGNSPTNAIDPSGLELTTIVDGTWHIDEQAYAQWMIAQAFGQSATAPSSSGTLSTFTVQTLVNAGLNSTFGPWIGGALGALNNAGYLPNTYMVGLQGDVWPLPIGGFPGTAQVGVNFNGVNPMYWEFGLIANANSGIKMPGLEYQGGVVASAVQNCQSLNQLQGWSGSLGLEANPALFGGGVSVSNLSSVCTPGGNPVPLIPADNLNGAVATRIPHALTD